MFNHPGIFILMETTDPILESSLFVTPPLLFLIVLLLFLIILLPVLRRIKKTGLDKIVARMEAEEPKDAGKNKPEKSPVLTAQPSPPPSQKEIPPAPKKKKKVIKESISISHNEENAGLPKAGSGSTASSRDKKSSLDEDFSMSSNEDSGSNWVEAEIPGLIIEPFPAENDSDTEPEAKSPAPAEKKASDEPKPAPAKKKSPDKPKPKEILTFKAAYKSKHKFGENEFEDFPSEKNLPSKVKHSAPKTVGKKATRPPEPEEIPELEPKDVEIKAIVVSHKDIAEKEGSKEKAPAPSAGDESTSGIEEPLELEAEIEAIPPEIEDRESAPYRPNPKPFFLDLKYLVEDELKAGPESSKNLSPGMVDRIVARLNELQNHLEHQLVSQPGKGGPAKRDMRHARIQDAAPEVAGTTEGLSEKKEVSLEELDGFLFTANRKKSQE